MSHFDDFDGVFMGGGPSSGIGALIFLVLVIGIGIYCCRADSKSEDLCIANGEKYVDSRITYTLCEKKDGTVVRR